MNFLSPDNLWFLLLALIPAILFLLFRRRRTEVLWGSTYILRLALASGRRQSIWRQLTVVAVRTAFLALLALAFARPFMPYSADEDGTGFPHGNGTLHRIVLIDNSMSMDARHKVGSRFDVARETLAGLAASMRPGDTFQFIGLCPAAPGARPAPTPVRPGTSERKIRETASSLKTQSTPMDFPGAMRAAVEEFRNSAAQTRQLVIITDLARIDHPSVEDYDIFGEMLSELKVRAATLNLGSRETVNIAFKGVSAGTELFLDGQPTNVYVDAVNYSDTAGPDARLQFFVDGQKSGEKPCVLPAGHERTFVFPVSLGEGQHRLEARLNEDAYTPDNQLNHFVSATKKLALLLVVPGEEKAEQFQQEEVFLKKALAACGKTAFSFDVETVKDAQALPSSLTGRDMAFLSGGSKLSQPFLDELSRFVQKGGGIIVSADSATDPGEFNKGLGQLLPVLLDAPARPAFDPERYSPIQNSDIGLKILKEFEESDNGDISKARIYNYFKLKIAPGARPPTAVLRLANGDPLLLAHPLGKGCVLLWTSTLGGAWSSLPVRQAYLPLVYRLCNYASSMRAPPRNVAPGAPLIFETADGADKLFMTTPDSQLVECPVVKAGGRSFVRFEKASIPGTYDLQDKDGKKLCSFSVSMPLQESDLRCLEDSEMDKFKSVMHTAITSEPAGLGKALWREGDGWERAGIFFAIAILLLMIDSTLTRIWFA